MDRRNFFKIVSSVSAGAATIACEKHKSDALIPLLVADHEIVPGEEQWHPAVCSLCDAGCGVIVRVMRGERVIERNGEKFREPIACIKKIEGNPLDSVSGGRLCARGHAALQSLYNPDRLRGPMKRIGDRGKAEFKAISWEQAISEAAASIGKARAVDPSKILFLTNAAPGTRSQHIQQFLEAIGSPAASRGSVGDFSAEKKAAEVVFGWKGVPRYDVGSARYVLGVGADFLGGWISPVYYARQYGHFRQGRPGLRGKLVQAESRMSLTAASADEWLPVRPGAESQLVIAVARMLLDEKLARKEDQLPAAIKEAILGAKLDDLIRATGVRDKTLRRIVRELGESEVPLVVAGASIVQTNSVDALVAAHYLNIMLGAGGVLPPNGSPILVSSGQGVSEGLKRAQLVLLDGENPVYMYPEARAALANTETVMSFGSFMDDSVAYADLILPDHHSLEAEAAVVPPVAGTAVAFAVTTPFVRPLYDTRAIQQTLGDISNKLNVKYAPATAESLFEPTLKEGETWSAVVQQGGLWRDTVTAVTPSATNMTTLPMKEPVFAGAGDHYPLQWQPYLSLQYHDGRGANLPWMQELPDPASSFMWGLPVELDPKTAGGLKIDTGDWVRVESPIGWLEAQAYVHPAAIPGVVSMGMGEGHTHYGRYASGKGANPLSIVAPVQEEATGALAFGATRVKLTKLDRKPGELAQFSPTDKELGPWGHR